MTAYQKSDYSLIFKHKSGAKLYVGNWDSSSDQDLLKEIGAIINCTSAVNKNFDDHQTNYLRIRLPEKGLEKYRSGFEFIEKYLSNGENVLVHCAAGVSRSVSIIIGYLILKKKWSFNLSYKYVSSIRRNVPNPLMYEKELSELALETKNGIQKMSLGEDI